MASETSTVLTPVVNLVQGSGDIRPANLPSGSGNSLPERGNPAGIVGPASRAAGERAANAAAAKAQAATDAQSLVNLLNKNLNDSGRPDLFRVAPQSDGKLIQQINPANGEVVGEFSASEFPALARSVGASGALVDSRA